MSVYLDYNATTPLDPEVAAAMQPWLEKRFGNPASVDHRWGWDAAEAVEDARSAVAELINARPHQISFTSGATEGLNTVIKSFAGYQAWDRKKIITCATEHDAVLATCRWLAARTGIEVQVLPVDPLGNLETGRLVAALDTPKQTLVALMAANNEIGVIHPIAELVRISHAAGALFLCDITQAAGKISLDVRADGVDMAVFSAHKMYGPPGVGALFLADGAATAAFEPLILGGGQEDGRRGGAPNTPGIVGFGAACRIADTDWRADSERLAVLRDEFEQKLLTALSDTWINGDRDKRIANTGNIGFAGIEARSLIRDMHDIGVSTRSACSSAHAGPSHVLKALGLNDDRAYASLRVSLGRFTTAAEMDYAATKLIAAVHKHRS